MAYHLLIFLIHAAVIPRELLGQNLLLVQFMNCKRRGKLLLAYTGAQILQASAKFGRHRCHWDLK
jgi:hypothetical protein